MEKVENIEVSAGKYLLQWTTASNLDLGIEIGSKREIELFELGWFCDDAISRSHLITFLYSHLDVNRVGRNPAMIEETFSCLKSIQHPQKGAFLVSKFHGKLVDSFREVAADDQNINSNSNSLLLKYSIESFNLMLKYFIKWSSIRDISQEELTSLYQKSFHILFKRVSTKLLCSLQQEEFLQTVIGEIINCADGYLQFLIFSSITQVNDTFYMIYFL